MTRDSYVKSQIATLAWREAHEYGGLDCMLTIAHVLRNRVRAAWEGGDWLTNIAHWDKFRADEPRRTEFPDIRNYDFEVLLRQLDAIYDGSAPDFPLVSGSDGIHHLNIPRPLYVGELNRVTNPWFISNICRGEHQRVAVVGPLTLWS